MEEASFAYPATNLTYLDDTYTFELQVNVIGASTGPKGKYLLCNETLLYPKGGGQPSDQGQITFDDGCAFSVTYVEYEPLSSTVRHYIAETDGNLFAESRIGSSATQTVDSSRRLANAKAHTAGHLLADVVSFLAPELIGKLGNHDPVEGCYVKFNGLLTSMSTSDFAAAVNCKLLEVLQVPRKVESRLSEHGELGPGGKPLRLVQIEGFEPAPCGGTHINTLTEIQKITCTKVAIVKKENVTKISYTVE